MEDLEAAREKRDAGWAIVKRAWLDGAKVDKEARAYDAKRPLAEAYEHAVSLADTCGDRIRDDAQRAAQLAELDANAAATTAALEKGRAQAAECDAAIGEWQSRWEAAWSAAKIAPASPGEMIEWLRRASEAQEKIVESQRIAAQMRDREETVAKLEARLRDVLRANDATTLELVALARERIDREKERAARRDQAKKALERHEREIARADEALRAIDARLAADRDALAQALPEVGLAADLDAATATRRLDALEQLAQRARALAESEERLAAARALVAAFDRDASDLVRELAVDAGGRAPEQTIAWLGDRASLAARAADARGADLEAAEAREAEAARERTRLEETARAIETLAPPGAANDAAAARASAERAIARAAKEKAKGEIELRLARQLGRGDARDADERDLASATADDLDATARALVDAIDDARREKELTREAIAVLRNDHEQLGGEGAARAQADLVRAKEQLAEDAERFAVLELAQAVLERVVELFTREHQPGVLRRASELLATITGGRYVRVQRDLGDDALTVIRKDGERRRPDELSTGTREQLFFALRLAYVVEYCDRAEPLPIIADDVLVSFDAERTARALAALSEVAAHTQVLLLTCHEHVVARARAAGAGAHVIELPQREFPGE
jgi:uncharacterized protein YhaN